MDVRKRTNQDGDGPVASFDYDVEIIGSGFGGSVAALRAAEKGYRIGVMESGRRAERAMSLGDIRIRV